MSGPGRSPGPSPPTNSWRRSSQRKLKEAVLQSTSAASGLPADLSRGQVNGMTVATGAGAVPVDDPGNANPKKPSFWKKYFGTAKAKWVSDVEPTLWNDGVTVNSYAQDKEKY